MNAVKIRLTGDSQLNDCIKGNTRVVQGRQGGLANFRQKQYCYRIKSYPARLQQVPLAMNTVFYVDQSQHVLLRHKERKEQSEKGDKRKSQNKNMTVPSVDLHDSVWY